MANAQIRLLSGLWLTLTLALASCSFDGRNGADRTDAGANRSDAGPTDAALADDSGPPDGSAAVDGGSTKAPSSTLGLRWKPAGPVLRRSDCAKMVRDDGVSLDCSEAVADPTIARATDGSLIMWFNAAGYVGTKGQSQKLYKGVLRARATTGMDFQLDPPFPFLSMDLDTWDRHVETVSVVYNQAIDRWDMWYYGADPLPNAKSFCDAQSRIGQMRSLDSSGLLWQRPGTAIHRPRVGSWDHCFMCSPDVLKGPDGVWRLYYTHAVEDLSVPTADCYPPETNYPYSSSIGLLTSTDGENWTPHADGPVFEGNGHSAWDMNIADVVVRHVGGRYMMWYTGCAPWPECSIGVAFSDDGVKWERHAGNPVITPGPKGSWNDLGVMDQDVWVERDGSLLMAAYGGTYKPDGTCKEWNAIGFWRSQ